MTINYVLRRLGFFVLVIWVATSLIFIFPRLAGRNPVVERMGQTAGAAGIISSEGLEEMVESGRRSLG